MISISWDITPCSLLVANRRFGGICHLNRIDFFLVLFLDLTIEATCSSETSFEFQRTIWYYIPEYEIFQYNNNNNINNITMVILLIVNAQSYPLCYKAQS
jgi:hypothetical protein